MTKTYYSKTDRDKRRLIKKTIGLSVMLIGFVALAYFSMPIMSYYLFLKHAYATNNLTAPIPSSVVLKSDSILSALSSQASAVTGTDYTNAKNWFPEYTPESTRPRLENYSVSIPKLKITDAYVSTIDYDVGEHLINYGGTAIPPERGNAVIFGHSTLPQLFNQSNYKTIFARLHTLETGDAIEVKAGDKNYTYKVEKMYVVDPTDFRPLSQTYDDSYLTLITCTPPGTIWQRLIVKARLTNG